MDHSVSNITQDSLNDIRSAGGNVIVFMDELPNGCSNCQYFLDSNIYLNDVKSVGNVSLTENDVYSEVTSFILQTLRNGLPVNKLNLMYYVLNVGIVFNEQFQYNSYFDYNTLVSFQLNTFLSQYNKITFKNIILIDFFEFSNIMDEIIGLNIKYNSCFDIYSGNTINDCAYLSSLSTNYYTNDITPTCTTPFLTTNCQRSCGNCPILSGFPGSNCTSNAECNSVYYKAYANDMTSTGTCFQSTPLNRNYIDKDSFCLTYSQSASSGNFDGNECNTNIINITADDGCSNDYQCITGYCNPTYSLCLNIINATDTELVTTTSNEKYNYDPSTKAIKYRKSVKVFRGGNPDGKYEIDGYLACIENGNGFNDYYGCLRQEANGQNYIASVYTFLLVPLVLSILLCICYTISCPFFCFCCSRSCHKVFCKPCVGEIDLTNDDKKSMGIPNKGIIPLTLLLISLICLIVGVIIGSSANAKIHGHLFDEPGSLEVNINDLYDDILSRFYSIQPTAQYIIDNIEDIIDDITDSLTNTTELDNTIDDFFDALNNLSSNYGPNSNSLEFTANITNPFDSNMMEVFTIPCDYCTILNENIQTINNTVANEVLGAITTLKDSISAADDIEQVSSEINNTVSFIQQIGGDIIEVANDTVTTVNDYINIAQAYDKQRSSYGFMAFLFPLTIVIMTIVAVFVKTRWSFKWVWCCSMYLGVVLFLILAPIVFVVVIWADGCVNIDEFETDPFNSKIGEFAGLDINDQTHQDIVNTYKACLNGESLESIYNLNAAQFNTWDQYRDDAKEAANYDFQQYLKLDEIEAFKSEILLLDVNDYTITVDEYIATLNAFDDNVCNCGGAQPYTFDRSNLITNECVDSASDPTYWGTTATNECREAYLTAYLAVATEDQKRNDITTEINKLKALSGVLFDTFDEFYGIVIDLENRLKDITCQIDPLFDEIETIVFDFTNCGFIGQAYGEFKYSGCHVLFNDFRLISTSLLLLAISTLLIVLFACCMDYIFTPPNNHDSDTRSNSQHQKDLSNLHMAVTSTSNVLDTPMTPQMNTQNGEQFPQTSNVNNSNHGLQLNVQNSNGNSDDNSFNPSPMSDDNEIRNDNINLELTPMDGNETNADISALDKLGFSKNSDNNQN